MDDLQERIKHKKEVGRHQCYSLGIAKHPYIRIDKQPTMKVDYHNYASYILLC